jgi:hypothetical protein
MDAQCFADAFDTAGDPVDGDCRGGDQPTNEAAARLIVAAQEDEDREYEHQRNDGGRGGAEDEGVHDPAPSSGS